MKYYLSACLFTKDENRFVKEWVDYHERIGVEHFYIYDNQSRIPIEKTLAKNEYGDRVEIIPFKNTGKITQIEAYKDCIKRSEKKTRWLAVIDTDEFIVPVAAAGGLWDKKAMRRFLSSYESNPALAISWMIYGSGGHETTPASVTKNFTLRAPADLANNKHVKCIVQPRRVRNVLTPHSFQYFGGDAVNENKEIVKGPYGPITAEKIRINHYFLRSRQDFADKIIRGRGDGVGGYNMSHFDSLDKNCNIYDNSINEIRFK